MQEMIKYQEIDEKLRKVEAELEQSTNKKRAVELQQFLKDGQAKLIKLESTAKSLTEQYQKAKKLYDEFVSKLETLSKNVNAIEGSKVEEYTAIVNNFSNKAENLENSINAMAAQVASVNKEFENIMNSAKKAKTSYQEYKKAYDAEKAKLEPVLKKLEEEKNKQKAKVDPKLMAKYVSKSEGKIFPIFVPETNGRCGRCRMEISASKLSDLKSKGTVECENCGRIIYLP